MDPGLIAGIIEGAANTTLSTANFGYGIFGNERQYANQVGQQDYQKWLNQMTMNREDTAMQRRVADLIAAGLHPSLAAGAGAGAQNLQAAPGATGNQELTAPHSNVASLNASIANVQANTRLVNAQAERIEQETPNYLQGQIISNELNQLRGDLYRQQYRREELAYTYMPTLNAISQAQLKQIIETTAQISYDLQKSRDYGIRTSDHEAYMTDFNYALNWLDGFFRDLGGTVNSVLPSREDVQESLQRMNNYFQDLRDRVRQWFTPNNNNRPQEREVPMPPRG